MTRLAVPAAALLAVVAAWLSQGTLAVAAPDGPRIALLPVSTVVLILIGVVAIAVIAAHRAGLSIAPIWLLIFVLLPWLPIPVPAAALAWSGAMTSLVWCGVCLLMLAPMGPRLVRLVQPTRVGAWVRGRPRLCAGVLAFVIFGCSARLVAPSIPGGDEPHYLIITQSLLLDRDLKIENNHRRGDYQAYYAGPLAPHYIRRGSNGEIYSIHAPGLSVLVAPAFAVAGYRGVVIFLVIVSACGSALAWHLSWLATKRASAAWFGWAAATTSATTIFHSFTVYPDGLGGVIVLTGAWAILRAAQERISGETKLRPWLLHGAALALLPWLHSRFALLAGSIGALVLLRLSTTKNPAGKAVAFLITPAVSAMCWVMFFLVVYGVPDPSAPYGSASDFSLGFIPGGLTGLLFDQRFGLIANAPVLCCAIGGLAVMLMGRQKLAPDAFADRRLALELLFIVVPYLLTATSYAMWWGGWSAPARFANPAVLVLSIPCAVAWTSICRRATKVIAAGWLTFTLYLSFVLVAVDGGRLAYNTRETTALWLDWASRLASLGEGVPAWFRGQEGVFARDVAIWIAAFALAWWVSRAMDSLRAFRDTTRFATATAASHAVAGMVALTIVWQLHHVSGVRPAPAQLAFLHAVATQSHAVLAQVAPPRLLARDQGTTMIRIVSDVRPGAAGGLGRNERPLVALPAVPAGQYRVSVRASGPGGWLLLGVGQDQFALRSQQLTWPPAPIDIDLPVDVRALVVRGDEDARRSVRGIDIEPVAVTPAGERLTDQLARRAVKYANATAFFLDERSFPEPDGFWIGGRRESTIVLQPDRPATSIDVRLRNAPVENVVTLTSGQWREVLTLAAGEERTIVFPIAAGRRAVLVTVASAAGFRPSESEAGSRDDRMLGVWVKVDP